MQSEERPWGVYHVLDEGADFKVKRIVVKPGGRLSLQSHKHRAEHWTVIRGMATVTIDGQVFELERGGTTFVPLGARHRLENLGPDPLEMVEVQLGSYVGEDDIIRYDDVYSRV